MCADNNGVVLLDAKREAPVGTRWLAFVAREISDIFPAISSLAVGMCTDLDLERIDRSD